MMPHFPRYAVLLAAAFMAPATANATAPKLDADTCTQLRLEAIKFRQSGILDDMSKGAEWAKSNLPPDRLREIEHYMSLDEQVKFGCRDAKLSPEAEKASEAAERIELNSDDDPTKPVAKDPQKPAAKAKSGKRTSHRKANSLAPKTENLGKQQNGTKSAVSEKTAPPPAVAESSSDTESSSGPLAAEPTEAAAPSSPAFGFGETMILPQPSGD